MKLHALPALLAVCATLAASDVIRPEMYARRIRPGETLQQAWQNAPEYPMLKNARRPEDFQNMPQEGTRIRLLADEKNLYLQAEMTDSDLRAEQGGGSLVKSSDALVIVLRPLGTTGFFCIECAPDKRVVCSFVPGGGLTKLPSAFLKFPVQIPVEIALQGTLNDGRDRDRSWSATVTIPMQKLLTELRKKGIAVRSRDGWSLLVGRQNFSCYLPWAESSGFPQPAPGFFDALPTHARLVIK